MKGLCPNCEKGTELVLMSGVEEIMVRGEAIPVNVEYLRCKECETEFRDPRTQRDPLETAYKVFRKRHGMLQPERIRELRERYALTQHELTELLGWGGATLSRYENGALQDDAHETVLRLIQEPNNLLELIEQKPNVLDDKKAKQIMTSLKKASNLSERSIPTIYENLFGTYEADIFSGYKLLDIHKLFNALVFFCLGNEIPKTKLNKLMFYADFKHFKDYAISITGVQYAHLPYGPAPDHYEMYLAALHDEEEAVSINEVQYNEYSGEYLQAMKEPVLAMFSTSELKILAMVKEQFTEFTAKRISDISHQEKGYQETGNGDLISYEYAQFLSI